MRRDDLLEQLRELLGLPIFAVERVYREDGAVLWRLSIEEPGARDAYGAMCRGRRYTVPNSTIRHPKRLQQFMESRKSIRRDCSADVGRAAARIMHQIAEV